MLTVHGIINLYVAVFITIFVYAFLMYLLTTISNVIIISAFGCIATWLARIRIRYVAMFNMSVYALTLSILLNMLYIAVNIFVDFKMEYFQVMYVSVASIYLVAAIFLLKTDYIKRQIELTKLAEAQEMVRKEIEEQQQEEEKKEQEKKERKEKDNEKKKKDDDNVGEEPEGSNA